MKICRNFGPEEGSVICSDNLSPVTYSPEDLATNTDIPRFIALRFLVLRRSWILVIASGRIQQKTPFITVPILL